MNDQPTAVKARLVYTGRIWRGNKPAGQGFLAEDTGQALAFGKTKARGVGYVYEFEVVLDEAGAIKSVYPDSMTWTGDQHPDADQVVAWQAADRAAQEDDNRRLAENKAKDAPDLVRAMEPLEYAIGRARSYNEAEAIADLVRSRLLRAYFEGKKR